jgi:phosphohistidine swiveling domain-containing protein
MALAMAVLTGAIASLQGIAEAGIIPSSVAGAGTRAEDLEKIQAFLENKVVVQKLVDYGVSPQEALEKVQAMNAEELHRLASLTDRAAVGADSGLGFLIGLAVLVILVIVILKLLNKEVIIR